jgi:hypothetical protein
LDFSQEAILDHPLERVFAAFRDRLAELVAFLPAIESIETVERTELGPGRVRLINVWQGNRAVAPRVVRPFATSKALRWRDTAEWDEADRVTDWVFETFQFGDFYDCAGRNTYHPHPRGTRFLLTGRLEVYPEKVPGVPRFLAGKLKPLIEDFVRQRVIDNLAELVRGVERLLQSSSSPG